jgi:uncharacterized protein YfdQ (DUF2303 family)
VSTVEHPEAELAELVSGADTAEVMRETERLVRDALTERPDVDFTFPSHVHAQVLRPGDKLVVADHEQYETEPVRPRGDYVVYDVRSFVTWLKRRGGEQTTLWAQQPSTGAEQPSITAVLNDAGRNDAEGIGWRDDRTTLVVRPDPDWTKWELRDVGHPNPQVAAGRWLSQADFADFMLDQVPNLGVDIANEVYAAALTFQSKRNIEITSVVDLDDGTQQFSFNETVQNGAERPGSTVMHKELNVTMRPFYGADVVQLRVLVRNRIGQGGKPVFGLFRHRPDLVEESAWAAWCETVTAELPDFPLLQGPPPASLKR